MCEHLASMNICVCFWLNCSKEFLNDEEVSIAKEIYKAWEQGCSITTLKGIVDKRNAPKQKSLNLH